MLWFVRVSWDMTGLAAGLGMSGVVLFLSLSLPVSEEAASVVNEFMGSLAPLVESGVLSVELAGSTTWSLFLSLTDWPSNFFHFGLFSSLVDASA